MALEIFRTLQMSLSGVARTAERVFFLEIVPEYAALIWILCCKWNKVYEVRFFHIFGIGINDFNIGSINTEDDTALERQSFSRMNISIDFVHNWLTTWRITLFKDFQITKSILVWEGTSRLWAGLALKLVRKPFKKNLWEFGLIWTSFLSWEFQRSFVVV